MFRQKKVLRLNESDASGVLYFAQQFRLAQELFEEYLEAAGLPLGEYLKNGEYLLPVVHAEGDFLAPIRVGDAMELGLSVAKIGTSSFTLLCQFRSPQDGNLLGTTSIVHVAIARGQWKSMPIPEPLKKILRVLQLPATENAATV